jgi:peptide/nickel transport system ATP-binding protein
VQAQILDLLKDLQQEFGSAIVFITHDLGVISNMADDLLVMYAGRAVERGSVREVMRAPRHPYTWGLLSSMPRLDSDVDEELVPIPGSPPSLLNPPSGCPFHPRCGFKDEVAGTLCTDVRPPLAAGRASACHLTAEQKQTIFIDKIQPRLR